MRKANALIAGCLLTLCACTPYSGTPNVTGEVAGARAQTLAQQRLTRSDCFWRFRERQEDGSAVPGDMIFAMSASKHVARIQLASTLYRLQIISSVTANPLKFSAEGLTVDLSTGTITGAGKMDAVLAITTQDGLSKIIPLVGEEECP